ncbi:hypothetical protein BBO99_00009526 [Phytophthora kernoviae]|uniref:Necrosis inducing-like protein NPP1 type n=1 Tax=Phytophthora kernoviae TaxID=325452 RepID=A0A3R7G084_9STRA|nr:hypothetical protein BBI17_000738 [Phytophthora kernoviae]RLN73212.1 hypothetical protein BBO99_00009526 [Phytophthora kernoviae]
MILHMLATIASLAAAYAAVIDYNEIEPFAQPEAVTVSEKAAVKFKPQLRISDGSQVYGRSAWHNNVWAIMYAWYFPNDEVTHNWENIVVWIDNPALEEPKVLGISTTSGGGYVRYSPPEKSDFDGDGPQINYDVESSTSYHHGLDTTSRGGDFQDLIMWDQLTEEARAALQNTNFGEAAVPFKDGNFTANLAFAKPYTFLN